MGLLDSYLSDSENSILKKRKAKIGSAFFILFIIVIIMSYISFVQLSPANRKNLLPSEIQNVKTTLIVFTVLIVCYLGWILFSLIRPTYITYLDLISDLLAIKNNVNTNEKPLASRKNTLLRFRELNYAVNNAVLYATIEDENRITYISKKFEEYLNLQEDVTFRKFEEILTYKHNQHHKIRKLLTNATDELVKYEIKLTNHQGEIYWLEMSVINMDNNRSSKRRLIVCNDITQRRNYNDEVQKINRERFVAEVQTQKNLSQQIISAQEDERKRIAKDIHDGIGQMLTSLRFSIDGINLKDTDKATKSLENLKFVFGELIKDVRTITFNLAPPELTDYGIGSALRKMSTMLTQITSKQILYENTSEFDKRLDKNIEINVYRVVQEAVNNALKYANASYILISISHTDTYLKVSISDDGIGFDTTLSNLKSKGTGFGLTFMQERVEYANGKILINSIPDKGTTISVAIPI